jgi:hypothetical protein
MLPWSFSEEGAADKHMAQLQHNMWVTNAKAAVLSIITGGVRPDKIGRCEARASQGAGFELAIGALSSSRMRSITVVAVRQPERDLRLKGAS